MKPTKPIAYSHAAVVAALALAAVVFVVLNGADVELFLRGIARMIGLG